MNTDSSEQRKKINNIFNEKIKKSEMQGVEAKKISESIDSYIKKNKELLDSKFLSIMKEVPDRTESK